MKIACLTERLERMPMVKIVLPVAAGIGLAAIGTFPLWFLGAAVVGCGVAALLLRSTAWTVTLWMVVGCAAAEIRTPNGCSVPRNMKTIFEVQIEEIPSEQGRYIRAEASVRAWRNPTNGHWVPSDARIMLYGDSLTHLVAGERIRCRSTLRPFRSDLSSYRRLMLRRGVVGTLRVGKGSLLERRPPRDATWHEVASARLLRLPMQSASGAVVRAMAVGDRSAITAKQRTVYAQSGLSHLLAVSGLHTGIVFALVNLLLWWLPVVRRGHLVRNVLVIVAIWSYVAIAGWPPSAVRAAVMCTLLQTVLATGSEYVGINALAAAALGMLLWNPAWIGDISFQLSFAAVAGILAWGVPIGRRLHTRYGVVNLLIGSYVVCAAASIATLPLVSHAFGIIPLAGMVVSPVAIGLATVVVACGVTGIIVPLGAVGYVADSAAAAITGLAEWSAAIPNGVVEYRLGGVAVGAIYLVFGATTLAAWCREPKKNVHLRS